MKLWKVSERDKREVGFNTREDSGVLRDYSSITSLKVRAGSRVETDLWGTWVRLIDVVSHFVSKPTYGSAGWIYVGSQSLQRQMHLCGVI